MKNDFSSSLAADRRIPIALLVLTSFAMLGGCTQSPPPPPTPPPAEVEVTEAIARPIREYREYTGRTAAVDSVEIRARVSGYLLQQPESATAQVAPYGTTPENTTLVRANSLPKNSVAPETRILVSEGELVEKGTLLFQIDPAPYELALLEAKGSLDAALAQRKRFTLDLKRIQELRESNSVSQADYDQAIANVAEIEGQIENLKAAVQRAELDVEFTQVRSPIDGYLGRTLITKGNLIRADETILTTVVSNQPIFVYFDVDERSLLDYRARVRQGSVETARTHEIEVQLALANDNDFPYAGVIDFVDNTTDPQTGNTRLRARFDNKDSALSPGLFARIRAPFTAEFQSVLVPTKAIGTDQQGKFVMIEENGTVQRRSVKAGSVFDNLTAVREGVRVGEKVVTSGLQKIRPGSPVTVAKPKSDAEAARESSNEKGASQ